MAADIPTQQDVAKSPNVKTKVVNLIVLIGHLKKCRHGEKCRHQTRCLYKHSKDDTNNTVQFNQSYEDKTLNLTAEIKHLKAEIVNLKSENDGKIKALVNIHLLELQDLQKEVIS